MTDTRVDSPSLRRQLGFAAVAAIVVGDMVGTGVFFIPGELAAMTVTPWHVYFFWALCGGITLCGALTLAELTSLMPRAGAIYHIIREGYGPFWAFLNNWMQMWVSGPGSVAGIAILFGEFVSRFAESGAQSAAWWGAAAIVFFATINLLGIQWGGRTQIVLTAVKVVGAAALISGSLFFAEGAPSPATSSSPADAGFLAFVRLVGLGVAAVLFTYDGWIDVTHVAGEVVDPKRNLPRGLGFGVGGVVVLYLLINFAYLHVLPLEAMRQAGTAVPTIVATRAFGASGARALDALLLVSIFGALGGLVMTLPRLFFAAAVEYQSSARQGLRVLFASLARISPHSAVPVGSIVFCAVTSIVALFFFGSFSRIVNSFVVPMHLANILMVSSVFKLRRRVAVDPTRYQTPFYPYLPLVYILVISFFLVSAVIYRPLDTLIGITLTATGVPAYLWIRKGMDR